MLYDALQNGVSKAAKKHFQLKKEMSKMSETYFLNRLDGYINFIGQVRGKEDVLVLKFKEEFKMIGFVAQKISYGGSQPLHKFKTCSKCEIDKPPEGGVQMTKEKWVCVYCWTLRATRNAKTKA